MVEQALEERHTPRIGVLALQGNIDEHLRALERIGVEGVAVKTTEQLDTVAGLIIPGGESTTIAKLMEFGGIGAALQRSRIAVWGTCAGMILMARELRESDPKPLGMMDIGVARNWFGRQIDSFETGLEIAEIGTEPFQAVFIRAPQITGVGDNVRVFARLAEGDPVGVIEGNRMATAFHPELTDDPRLHRLFLSLVMCNEGASVA